MLKLMTNFSEFDVELQRIPIWNSVSILPLKFWNVVALGRIDLKVGIPFRTDVMMAFKECVSDAHISV